MLEINLQKPHNLKFILQRKKQRSWFDNVSLIIRDNFITCTSPLFRHSETGVLYFSFCRRPLRAVGSSLWITGWCCHKMAKGGKLEPWKWHVLVHLL